MKKKNILFITNGLSYGGAEKMVVFIADSLNKRGHNVLIVNINGINDVSNYKREVPCGILVEDINANKRIQQIFEIKRVAKKFSADVLIGFTSVPNILARIVGFLLNKPSIMSERGDPRRTINLKGLKNKFYFKIINSSSGGVFQTEGARDFFDEKLKKEGVIIPNPIEINEEIPTKDYLLSSKSIVSIGRLDNLQKRYDVMLDSFELFLDRHPEYILKIYGRGSDENIIKNWVKEKNIEDKVLFLGLTDTPMKKMIESDIFIITSDYEGISNALLEAMAVGMPCVSTDHTPGGARLLINDHKNGLLAPIGDSKKIANALCEFVENPILAKKCGENAKNVVNRFSKEKIINLWENYIVKICKKK